MLLSPIFWTVGKFTTQVDELQAAESGENIGYILSGGAASAVHDALTACVPKAKVRVLCFLRVAA